MPECRRFLVSGRVQGVFFRASTAEQARALALTGHAVNLPDGRVEVLACGPKDALDRLQRWLWEGPRAADVHDVQVQQSSESPPSDFTTG